MSRATLMLSIALAALAGGAHAQQIRTYTQNQSGAGLLPLGYPVPLPIESLTPVDGFRSYASLDARLQSLATDSADLSAHDVGRTFNGRPMWAYVVGDGDGVDVEGRAEAAFFIRAATHAREWAAPEVSTGLVERMIEGAGDDGIVRYLLDNTRVVIIPVHNIDGFLQTQRYPTQVIVGQDPDVPNDWPRDGRMRRKNMRDVDEVLTTLNDHLGGIDLNRNHPPFWATSVGNGSSANPNSLTYHGSGPHSEPENLAVEQAAMLGPVSRMRLGIDVHTFSSVLFTVRPGPPRLTAITNRLVGAIVLHHENVPTANGQANRAVYVNVPEPIGRGIGTASEYFGYNWLVPAWTLELEPGQAGSQQYGGFNTSHSGFILPANQARRVREAWAESHLVAFYFMAGAPHLARVRIRDAASGALLREERWTYDADTRQRVRRSERPGNVQAGQRVRIELAFSKPMRHRVGGAIAWLPGSEQVPLQPTVTLIRGNDRTVLDTSAGQWQEAAAARLRYRDDTFAFETTAPADGEFRLEVDAQDMVGLALDAAPATPLDWEAGAWTAWEDNSGAAGDSGGIDGTTAFVVGGAPASGIAVVDTTPVVGEGDVLAVTMSRAQAGAAAIEVAIGTPDRPAGDPQLLHARWEAGEEGTRFAQVGVGDDLQRQGDRDLALVLTDVTDPAAPRPLGTLTARVLDNDRPEAGVLRVHAASATGLGSAIASASASAGADEIVLDGDQRYDVAGGSDERGVAVLQGPLRIHGNGAVLGTAVRSERPLIFVDAGADVTLDRAAVFARPFDGSGAMKTLDVRGVLRTVRSQVNLGIGSSNAGTLRFERSLVRSEGDGGTVALAHAGGTLALAQSTVTGSAEWQVDRAFDLSGSTLAFNPRPDIALLEFSASAPNAPLRAGHALLRRNGGATITPPPVTTNCNRRSNPATSLGYNIEDGDGCGFDQPTDRALTAVPMSELLLPFGGYVPAGVAIDGGANAADATGTGCGAVDQRGAPRPQTLTAGAVPRCDVGAVELGISPYRGIWQPERAGHGIDLQTSGNQLLLAWYTYADDGQPTAYQAIAPLTGRHWEATLRLSRRDPQSGAITLSDVGRVMIDFDSNASARLRWRFDAHGVDGSERIQAYAFHAIGSRAPLNEVTGLWYPPAEAGYGATITRRRGLTAIGLYYYDAGGTLRWALGTGGSDDAVDVAMSSYTGFCPDCDAAQMPVQSRPAGALLAHFLTPARARIDVDLLYPGSAGGRWLRERADFVPLNDPVDELGSQETTPPTP